MTARRPSKPGANSRPVPNISIASPATLSSRANTSATYSMRIGQVSQLPKYTR
jgi:hypothetical protein